MKLLGLLRHAKSDWEDSSLGDFDRPLSERGRKAAPAMGKRFRELGLGYDLALVSPARRAADTYALVRKAWAIEPELRVEPRLYLATAQQMLGLIAETPPDVARLLIVGHNPGLHQLALHLTLGGNSPERDALAEKLPTAALVEVEMHCARWGDATAGELVRFLRPRDLR